MKQLVFLSGKFVDLKDAKVSVLDRGFLYGDGLFETMRAYNGEVFMLEEHIRRLYISLKVIKIKPPFSEKHLAGIVNKTISINKLLSAYVKVVVSRGTGPTGIDMPYKCRPTVLVYAASFKAVDENIYKRGIAVTLPSVQKNEMSFTARIKSLNYLDNILARDEVRRDGYFESVFLNTKGHVTETATTNIFIIKGPGIITPPPTAGLLSGITRDAVIGLIKKYLNNKMTQADITLRGLVSADEIFLTNSTHELIPVIKVGRYIIGNGAPGPFYKFLHLLYRSNVN